MTTQKQAEANRRNAKQSTGPKSEAGKARSRRNALDHGLTGNTVLPPSMEAKAAKTIAEFSTIWITATELDRRHLEQAAIASVRIMHAFLHEESLTCEQIRRAELFWEEDHMLEAAQLLDRLPKNPEVFARELQRTTQGCEVMIERWEMLREVLVRSQEPWSDAFRGMALDLLGVRPDFRETSHDNVKTVEEQLELADREITWLRKHQDNRLDGHDSERRERAMRGYAHPTREIWRIRQYEQAAQRAFNRSMSYLNTHCPKAKTAKPTAETPKPKVETPPPVKEAPARKEEPVARRDIETLEKALKLRPVEKTGLEDLMETLATPSVPAKPKGNAEYRKKKAHMERKAAKAGAKMARAAK